MFHDFRQISTLLVSKSRLDCALFKIKEKKAFVLLTKHRRLLWDDRYKVSKKIRFLLRFADKKKLPHEFYNEIHPTASPSDLLYGLPKVYNCQQQRYIKLPCCTIFG